MHNIIEAYAPYPSFQENRYSDEASARISSWPDVKMHLQSTKTNAKA